MSNMLTDFAQGVGHALIDNTRAGKVFLDPLMDDTPKQAFKKEQMDYQRESMAFSKESRARQKSLWGQQDQARAMKFQTDLINGHGESSKKNFMATAEGLPEYQNLTDVDKNKYLESAPAKNLVKFQALSRMGMQAFDNPDNMPAFKRMAQESGMAFTEKDGKRFITSPDGKDQIELTDDNFATMMNGLQGQAAQELQVHAAMSQWSNDIAGQSKNDMIKAIADRDEKGYASAYSDMDKFYKANNFSPQEKRVHYLHKGLEKYFDDGVITNEEKQGVMQQLQFLAQGMGIKHSQDEGGNIFVVGEKGVPLPLKMYYDQLGELDKVGARFNEFMGGGMAGGQSMLDSELLENIPQQFQGEANEVLAPLYADTHISSKDREKYAESFKDLLIGAEHIQSPEMLKKLLIDISNDLDLPYDNVLKYAPLSVQKIFADIEAGIAAKEANYKKSAEKLWEGVKNGKSNDATPKATAMINRVEAKRTKSKSKSKPKELKKPPKKVQPWIMGESSY